MTLGGFDGKDFDIGVLLFEVLASAGHGTARTLRQDQCTNLALGLFPDFRAGCAIMSLDVIEIDELANLPVFARRSCLELLDLLDNQIYIALSARCEHEFRTIRTDGLLAFLAHTIRHDNNHGIALCGPNTGSGNACVACGAFNDSHARPQIATP